MSPSGPSGNGPGQKRGRKLALGPAGRSEAAAVAAAAGVDNVYSQNEGGDVGRAGAQRGDRLQFVVVQLSVWTKTKKGEFVRSGTPHEAGGAFESYSSVRRCARENMAPPSTCSRLWLRSLQKEGKTRVNHTETRS